MPPHPPGPPSPSRERTKPSFTVDLEEESDVDMTELAPLPVSEDEPDFGDDNEEIPDPGPPPEDMEEETFQSAEEATRTEGEEEPTDRSDPTYRLPHISPHPCESYSTTRTLETSGSMIWPKIRDLMKEIPAPEAVQWNANDSRFNTGLRTGERERLLNEEAKERLDKAPSI